MKVKEMITLLQMCPPDSVVEIEIRGARPSASQEVWVNNDAASIRSEAHGRVIVSSKMVEGVEES